MPTLSKFPTYIQVVSVVTDRNIKQDAYTSGLPKISNANIVCEISAYFLKCLKDLIVCQIVDKKF